MPLLSLPADWDIDRIVQDVLHVLTERNPAAVRTEQQDVPVILRPAAAADMTAECRLDNRVISLADIREQPETLKRICISPKSILTPSAKDELRKRNVEIIRCLPETEKEGARKQPVLWWGISPPSDVSEAVRQRLQKAWHKEAESSASLPELLAAAEKHLTGGGNCGVILTPYSASALYRASRETLLRPMTGTDKKQIQEDTAELNANLLILSPRRTSEPQILEFVQQFLISVSLLPQDCFFS